MVIYIHGIPIKIVTYINKRKLFMANVVTKLDGDVRWGAMLGVIQGDLDKTRSMLNLVINQVDDVMQRRVKELANMGYLQSLFSILQHVRWHICGYAWC
jgi:hypothetical protein